MKAHEIYQRLNRAYFSEQMDEWDTIRHLSYILKDGDLFVDVGASLGPYTYHVSQLIAGGEIIAIEADPVRFEKDLRVTIQSLGWQSKGRYLPLQDDLASVAYWYQLEPHNSFPPLPAKEKLVILAEPGK